MLCETNPQEVMDLSPVAHWNALGKVPLINFFDGFHIQKIEKLDYADLKEMCNGIVHAFRAHC